MTHVCSASVRSALDEHTDKYVWHLYMGFFGCHNNATEPREHWQLVGFMHALALLVGFHWRVFTFAQYTCVYIYMLGIMVLGTRHASDA